MEKNKELRLLKFSTFDVTSYAIFHCMCCIFLRIIFTNKELKMKEKKRRKKNRIFQFFMQKFPGISLGLTKEIDSIIMWFKMQVFSIISVPAFLFGAYIFESIVARFFLVFFLIFKFSQTFSFFFKKFVH